jgi:hypothetical protein
MACRDLKLRMEERPPIWRVDTSILNKHSRTTDKVRSSSSRVGRGAKTPHFNNELCCETAKT